MSHWTSVVRGQLAEWVIYFYQVGSSNWTLVVRFGDTCLYPLSHLAGPQGLPESALHRISAPVFAWVSAQLSLFWAPKKWTEVEAKWKICFYAQNGRQRVPCNYSLNGSKQGKKKKKGGGETGGMSRAKPREAELGPASPDSQSVAWL